MKSILHTINEQLSSHINREYPYFVEFLKAYYEWLETPGSPYYHLKNHLSFLDFQESVNTYTDLLKKEYLYSMPEKVLADKELLIKYSKQFHQSVGTERAFKFIFNILYGEDITIAYPRDNILRGSDGQWVENEKLMYCSNSGAVDKFLYRRIVQTREVFPGVFEYASATVGKIIRRYANKFEFCELYVTDTEGEFKLGWPIMVDDVSEWILPISSGVNIINPGVNYAQDNVFEYAGSTTFDVELVAFEAQYVDCKYTTLFTAGELDVELNGVPLTGFEYNGKILTHPDILPGDEIRLRLPIYSGLISVDRTNGGGTVTMTKIIDTPFGILEPQTYIGTSGGSGAVIEVIPGVTLDVPGYFFDTKGFLSADKVLQDSDYYQDFSYVIRAGIDIERYRDVVMSVLHPAGMKMFGEVNIIELIRLMIREFVLDITILAVGDISEVSSVDLYSRFGFIEDWKNKSNKETYVTGNFGHVKVGDVVSNPNRFYNVHDSMVDVV